MSEAARLVERVRKELEWGLGDMEADLDGLHDLWERDGAEWGDRLAEATGQGRARRDALAALRDLEAMIARQQEALDKGRRFERAYQESVGATLTQPQQERLDSLQSAFLDAYLAALAAETQGGER